MAKSLLIVTADNSFAQVLLYGLEQAGHQAYIVKGKGETVVRADEKNSTLALLDMDLGYKTVLEIGKALRALKPDIKLILFSNDEPPPSLDEIHPWSASRKPYYLPELLTMINDNSIPNSKSQKATSALQNSGEVETNIPLPWLQDVTKAAQHLTRLTLESSAQAALITRRDNLWAYAGQLSQDAAKELAVTVTRHWDGQKGSDLLRFVRLEATKAEHMLYATRIADDVVLALVFDAETPFSTIRTQAGQLAHSLSITPIEEVEKTAAPVEKQRPVPAAFDTPTQVEDEEDESGPDSFVPNISDILSDVPPPRPHANMIPLPNDNVVGTHSPSPRSKQYSRESSPAARE